MRSHVRSSVARASTILSALKLSAASPIETLHQVVPRGNAAASKPPLAQESSGIANHVARSPHAAHSPLEVYGSLVLGTRAPGSPGSGIGFQLLTQLPTPSASMRGDFTGRRLSSTSAESREHLSASAAEETDAEVASHVAQEEQGPEATEVAFFEATKSETEADGAHSVLHTDGGAASVEQGLTQAAPPSSRRATKDVRFVTSSMARRIRKGRSREAIGIFTTALKRGCIPDVPLYTTAIQAFAQLDKRHDAERTYQEMLDEGLKPSERCVSVMLGMYTRARELDKAWALYDQLRAAGMEPAPQAVTQLINCAWAQHDRALAESFFAKARAQGTAGPSQWGVMIQSLIRAGLWDEGLGLLQEMALSGVTTNSWTLTNLAQSLLADHAYAEALTVVTFMANHGPKPNIPTFAVLLDALAGMEGEGRAWIALMLRATEHKAYNYLVSVGGIVEDEAARDGCSLVEVMGEEPEDAQEVRRRRAFVRTVTELLYLQQMHATAARVWEEAQVLGLFDGRILINSADWKPGKVSQIDAREMKPGLAPFVAQWALLKLAQQVSSTGQVPTTVELVTGWRREDGNARPTRSEETVSAISAVLQESGIPFLVRKGWIEVTGVDLQVWVESHSPQRVEDHFVDLVSASAHSVDVAGAAALLASQVPTEQPSSILELVEVLVRNV